MKRDFELVRRILEEAESKPAATPGVQISFPGEFPQPDVLEHCELMIKAGLLEGRPLRAMSGLVAVQVTQLTWAGHDFLAATRDATVWAKAKTLLVERGGAITFDLLLAWMKKEVAGRLGIQL
jgi:hypothetical protein